MKQRYSSLDVKIIAHELSNSLVNLRLQNIYDLSSKIFLLKFGNPDIKKQVVVETGFRCHLTEYSRATAASPTVFVQGLRKRLKTRRVTSVSQIGTDRVLELEFSDGLYRLFIEFYASGNIILTDKELNILVIQRIVPRSEGQEELRIGLKYILDNRQNYGGIPSLTLELIQNTLKTGIEKYGNGQGSLNNSKKKSKSHLIKSLATSITEFPPALLNHALKVTGFDVKLSPIDILQDEKLLIQLLSSMKYAQQLVEEITRPKVVTGYIISKKKSGYEETVNNRNTSQFLIYDDFHPFRPVQLENEPSVVFLEIEGYNRTVDKFFSSIESQKTELKLEERELTAKRKIEAVRKEQEKRLEGLQHVQTLNERKAGAIQANIERVQEAMDTINSLISQGMDWIEIAKLIEVEQRMKSQVALIIKLPLKLHENTITLTLDEEILDDVNSIASKTDSELSDSEDEVTKNLDLLSEKSDKRLVIDINLGLSPWANARLYFDERRTAIYKEEKTKESSVIALKNQEAKIMENLRNSLKKEKEVLRPVRQISWFERFFWFLSSDRYLVLAGKDAMQNEILYKKHLKKNDIYVSADLEGAAFVVIKKNTTQTNVPIPPSTLSEAGTLAVSCSSAWDSKASMPAWWVHAEQVSKSAPTGNLLSIGSFHIQGTKNFLSPSILILGFGVLFRVDNESASRHIKHRVKDLEPENSSVNDTENTTLHESILPSIARKTCEIEPSLDSQFNPDPTLPLLGSVSIQYSTETKASGDKDDYCIEKLTQQSQGNHQTMQGKEFEQDIEKQSNEEKADIPEVTDSSTPFNPTQIKRGKRGKAKKIATKYKNQDLEDRIAAQIVTGAVFGQKRTLAEAANKAARESEFQILKEKKKNLQQKALKQIAEDEELRQQMFQKEVDVDIDGENLMVLDTLFGRPMKGDKIVEAIPVCAPLSAMKDYKYKIKIQPGSVKRGKIAKEILSRWLTDGEKKAKIDEKSEDIELLWPRELELLRGWKFEEITGALPVSKMRIMVSTQKASTSKGNGKGATKKK
ncbi:Ribosome quality control complex subunit 2 [Erysiphe neolycopersici]|uniref:Ribosome quality control complex subunit 2 n=1 Tax=Erysiphe neolycopersici TaxID=212602 RepID=A0A420HZ91_9PEZI|nr:Ribosome quality control complex subunit 2 [Erysiphe neolycopersici]